MIKEERLKSKKNLMFGILNKVLIILLGMLVPKIIISYLGSGVNGMLSAINQVYGYVTILEAGIGFATTQALYCPIAGGDREKINGILSATNSYYRKIGFIYLGLILVLTCIFPYIGHSLLLPGETRLLVFFTGISGVITFFFQGKFLLYLEAEGKSYISYNVTSISTILTYLIKVLLIISGFKIVSVQLVVAIIQVSVMLYYANLKKKKYGWIDYNSKRDFKAIGKKNSVFFHRVCWFVFSNTDILFISVFLNYAVASVYTIYSLIFSTAYSVIGIVWNSTVFYWGQRYHLGTDDFKRENLLFQKVYYAVVFCGNSILYLLSMPFIELYMRGVNDADYVDNRLRLLFALIYILQGLRMPSISLTEVAGYFQETKNQAIIESVLNLLLSVILVQVIGVYGILIGTIAAVAYRDIALVLYVSKQMITGSHRTVFLNWGWNGGLSFIVIFLGSRFSSDSVSWGMLFLLGVKVTALAIGVFAAGNILLIKKYLVRERK